VARRGAVHTRFVDSEEDEGGAGGEEDGQGAGGDAGRAVDAAARAGPARGAGAGGAGADEEKEKEKEKEEREEEREEERKEETEEEGEEEEENGEEEEEKGDGEEGAGAEGAPGAGAGRVKSRRFAELFELDDGGARWEAPPLPTVAPTRVPTVHSLPPSLLLPLPVSLLYTHSLPP
jgi:hypothetical protein